MSRLLEIVEDIQLSLNALYSEGFCEDFDICTEAGCIENSLNLIKEKADEDDSN